MEYVFLENSDENIILKDREIRKNFQRVHNYLKGTTYIPEDGVYSIDLTEYGLGCNPDLIEPFQYMVLEFEGAMEAYEGCPHSMQLEYYAGVTASLQKAMEKL